MGSSVDIVTPLTPPYKGNIFNREGSGVYLLDFVRNAYRPEVDLELPKEVIDLPCVPCPIIGWSLERIPFWGSGHLTWPTSTHVTAMHTLS